MNQSIHILGHLWFALAMTATFTAFANNPVAIKNEESKSAPIPMDQLGAVAGKQYQGDGLSVSATPDGARLRCAFQRLEGQVTREGLWLSSTADGSTGERFRVRAMEAGRVASDFAPLRRDKPCAPSEDFGFDFINPLTRPSATLPMNRSAGLRTGAMLRWPTNTPGLETGAPTTGLPRSGIVNMTDNVARFIRPGVTEEYTVSVDGVRQDFIIEQQPAGDGELRVELEVTGAKAEPLVNGARLVLDGSGRKLAYNRLRVVDATGRELPARMEVASGILPDVEGAHPAAQNLAANNSKANLQATPESAGLGSPAQRQARLPAATKLAVLVDDAAAIYPVRIDPTFSDADWVSMGGILGANDSVRAAVTDDSGNLYIGGLFTMVGDVFANGVAKWNGSSWEPLGSGIDVTISGVYALAVLDNDVYAGGGFGSAGGNVVHGIAKWDGSGWTPLGVGMNGIVLALAVSGSELYAGGTFTLAGGSVAKYVAKWDGSNWSALGSGVNDIVQALAVSGGNLYVGGQFWRAGDNFANSIAKWDGSVWSALGTGMNDRVFALAVSGSDLYAGGIFTTAGSSSANSIAKWDGNVWSALGTGMGGTSPYVHELLVSGNDIYAGGEFKTAGGSPAFGIARWNGSTWSALGDENEYYRNRAGNLGRQLIRGREF